jgi:hypothetical protein
MNCQFMFCFHVKTRDFEREGRFFDGGRKLFGTTSNWVTAKIPKRLITQTQTQLFGFPHFLKRRQNSPKHLFINLTEFNDYIE